MLDEMIKTTFGELEIGDEFWKNNYSLKRKIREYRRIKVSRSEERYADHKATWPFDENGTVYIKEKKMDKKQRAMERIKNAEAELALAKEMLAEEEVTYSIGDVFETDNFTLRLIGYSCGTVGALIENECSGQNMMANCGKTVKVKNWYNIKAKELEELAYGLDHRNRI